MSLDNHPRPYVQGGVKLDWEHNYYTTVTGERSGGHSYSRPHDSHSENGQQSAHQAEIK